MSSDFVIAVDPGGTTGVAVYNRDVREWYTYQLAYNPTQLHEFFMGQMWGQADHTTLICERFNYRAKGKYDFGGSRAIPKIDLTPVKVIGILELSCAECNVDIIWQDPSDVNGDDGAKTNNPTVFWTDDKVKQLGLYKPSRVHAMDAVKHILHYRAFTKQEQELFRALKYPSMFKETIR